MITLSTHVLDATSGTPAAGVAVTLASGGAVLVRDRTNDDGRIGEFTTASLQPGVYTLTFATGEYFAGRRTECFYPEVVVTFRIPDDPASSGAARHLHVPLLLSPYSYSTYRGS